MGGFWDDLDKINATIGTTHHGINKVLSSKGNLDNALKRLDNGEAKRYSQQIAEYEDRGNAHIHWTIAFCLLLIIATILICVFF